MHQQTRRLAGMVTRAALLAAVTLTPMAKAQAEPLTLTALAMALTKWSVIAGGIGGGITGLHALKQMQAEDRAKAQGQRKPLLICLDRKGRPHVVDASVRVCPNP